MTDCLVKLHPYLRYLALGIAPHSGLPNLYFLRPIPGAITRGYTAPAPATVAFHATTGLPGHVKNPSWPSFLPVPTVPHGLNCGYFLRGPSPGRFSLGQSLVEQLKSLSVAEFPGDLSTPGSMRAATSRRIRRPPCGRVSVSKDLMGEDLPSILLSLFPVLQVWLTARDCSEPRVQSRRP